MLNAAEVFYAEKFLDPQQIDAVEGSRIPGYDNTPSTLAPSLPEGRR